MVELKAGAGGLAKDSFAICYQAATLGKEKLLRKLGTLDAANISRVETGLKAAFGML